MVFNSPCFPITSTRPFANFSILFPYFAFFFFCVTKGPLKHLDNLQFAKVTYYLDVHAYPNLTTCLLGVTNKKYTQSSRARLKELLHNAFSDVQKMLSENTIWFQPQRKRKYEPYAHKKMKKECIKILKIGPEMSGNGAATCFCRSLSTRVLA